MPALLPHKQNMGNLQNTNKLMKEGDTYYTPNLLPSGYYRIIWNDDFIDHFNMENNLCHETMEEAIKHSEALLTKKPQ